MRNLYFTLLFLFINNLSFSQDSESLTDYIGFYQKFLSESRGSECVMHPSCSNYGLQAFKTYKPLKAFSLTSDRLFRCGHDGNFYNTTIVNGNHKLLDTIPSKTINKNIARHIDTNSSQNIGEIPLYDSCNLDYVKYLIDNNEYNIALDICYRQIFAKSNDWRIYNYYIVCLQNQKRYNKIIDDYSTRFPAQIKNNKQIIFELGYVNLELNNYSVADSLFTLSSKTSDSFLADKSYLMSGFCNAKQNNFPKAIYSYSKIDDESVFKNYSDYNINLINSIEDFSPKSPTLAGILGIIPGLGYLYSGHRQSAFTALIFNSIMFYATYTSFKSENYGIGILTGVFTISFYSGNIYGGVKGAKRFNEAKYNQLYNQLKISK